MRHYAFAKGDHYLPTPLAAEHSAHDSWQQEISHYCNQWVPPRAPNCARGISTRPPPDVDTHPPVSACTNLWDWIQYVAGQLSELGEWGWPPRPLSRRLRSRSSAQIRMKAARPAGLIRFTSWVSGLSSLPLMVARYQCTSASTSTWVSKGDSPREVWPPYTPETAMALVDLSRRAWVKRWELPPWYVSHTEPYSLIFRNAGERRWSPVRSMSAKCALKVP